MHLNCTYKNSWNRKQNKVCVTLDSELYRRKPVLTYAISGNVVGGFGEFGDIGPQYGIISTVMIPAVSSGETWTLSLRNFLWTCKTQVLSSLFLPPFSCFIALGIFFIECVNYGARVETCD